MASHNYKAYQDDTPEPSAISSKQPDNVDKVRLVTIADVNSLGEPPTVQGNGSPDTAAKPLDACGDTSNSVAVVSSNLNSQGSSAVSKNQLKRIKRWERKMEVKKRRKQQEKDAKMAMAKAQGRDLDLERKQMEARAATGEGKRKRQAQWETKISQAFSSFQICIDCNFENEMNEKEINSLAQQLRYCYASNRRSPAPCLLSAVGLGGRTLQHLQNVSGSQEWGGYSFDCVTNPLHIHFDSKMSSIVYLTSDSESVLQTLDNDKIYVIGGIVDRNRLKGGTLMRAKSLGVATAKLPLDVYLQEMETTKVLTCNHVFDILLKYKELKDWKKAFMEVLPSRKKAKFASEGETEPNAELPL